VVSPESVLGKRFWVQFKPKQPNQLSDVDVVPDNIKAR
jgi:hypothetical protein